jgi:transglutaminase-like putative cysteine protease
VKQSQQIPRNALGWIILCQLLLLAPHALRVPLWLLVLYAAAFAWRAQLYRERARMPPSWLKLVLIGATMAAIGASYGTLIGLEPTVALLLAAYALKLVESVCRKDAYVLIFLGFFLLITEFLFTQDLLIVAYSLLVVWLLTTALVALHRTGGAFEGAPLRTAGVMLLQAAPLMLVLFFLFPRIGPLWNVPVKSHTAKTGMSDHLSPGDVARLTQSTEVAFRARFQGSVPPASELYWRGLVLSILEDDSWRSLRFFEAPPSRRRPQPVATAGEPLEYSVIIEPTQQNWLYALRYAEPQGGGIMALADYTLYSPVVIENERRYRVRSWPDATLSPTLPAWRRDIETRLPAAGNPRARALGQRLRAAVDSDAAFVTRVLALFREQPFRYTLEPALLGEEPVDEFLFDDRAGFCEHYASAFALLMRAGGVPARIVAGYQGGEVNPMNGTVIVHQFDAHAWNEVWLAERGWVRVDPTAAVSPARVEFGLESALREEGGFLASSPLSPLRYRAIGWINTLRLRYDALTYRWQSWVVGFDSDRQYELLREVFGQIDARRFIAVTLGAFVLVMAGVALSLLVHRGPRRDPRVAVYLALQRRLQRRGLAPEPGETPGQLLERAARAFPEDAEALAQLRIDFEGLLFEADPDDSRAALARLHGALRRLRLRPA